MAAVWKHLGILLLFVSCGLTQSKTGTASVQNVTVTGDESGLRVEVTLTSPVQPSIETVVHPERILLDFPGTTCAGNAQREVNANGVLRVRMGQHSAVPPVTRLVLDLEQEHGYTLKVEGNRVIVTVAAVLDAHVPHHSGAAPAAVPGSLSRLFRRKPEIPASLTADRTPAPAPLPPLSSAMVVISGPASSATTVSTAAPASAPTPSSSSAASSRAAAPPPFSARVVAGTANQSDGSVSATNVFPTATTGVATAANKAPVDATAFDAKAADTRARDTRPVAATPFDAKTEPTNTAMAKPLDTAPPIVQSPVAQSTDAKSSGATSPHQEALDSTAVSEPKAAPSEGMVLARNDDPSLRTVFRVKYVAEGVAYLEGGRAQGLAEGMKLEIEDASLTARQGDSVSAVDPRVVAELEVSGIAETSAVTEIHAPKRSVRAGDLAYLSNGDAESLVQQRALSSTRQYPAVISFSEGDTLDEEAREEVPRPPLPSVNRARGRIGLDYVSTVSHGASNVTSSNLGVAFRGDITRIGGTYWNLSGYWRGRLTAQSPSTQPTLQDLINHTYHLSLTYDNPDSNLVAGFGRLYLPWAASLDTIDGGYFGLRLSKRTTLGIFGGSSPDPSSWNYSPDRVMGGSFVNFDGGSYDAWHYSSTSGAGISMLKWQLNRPFAFVEDTVSYGQRFGVYEAAQFDSPVGNTQTPAPGPGLGRSFFTLRVQPHPRLELDFNHNYFRDVPTFDPALIGTTLLDKFLFEGFSAGARLEVVKQVFLSTTLGRSNRSGDKSPSLNQMYGITFNRLPMWQLRADAHYARFNSSLGSGSYEAFTLSRQFSENLRLEILAGQQNFSSAVTTNSLSRFFTSTTETTLGPHYYMQGNFTINRGQLSYDQWMLSLGYRFDSKTKAHQ
jgi:hypothetical protein